MAWLFVVFKRIIMIAHRLKTVRNADQIVVVKTIKKEDVTECDTIK